MNEAPSTRHGDVLLTVWVIVGATTFIVMTISDTLRLPQAGLALAAAVAAGYGETVARAIRPHVRFVETAIGVIIAMLLVPSVARFGAPTFDREGVGVMAVGIPIGLVAAALMHKWRVGAGNFPEVAAGVAMSAAAVGLGVIVLRTIVYPDIAGRHAIDVSFVITGALAGFSFGALVPGARWSHMAAGAALVLFAPAMFRVGVLRGVPVYDAFQFAFSLGAASVVGCLAGRTLRGRLEARAAGASVLPAARVHEGDAGETQDPG